MNIHTFLIPFIHQVRKTYNKLKDRYPLITSSIKYNGFIYYLNFKYNIHEVESGIVSNTYNFNLDYPIDVLDYINKIDVLYENRATLNSLYRKLLNEFSTNIADHVIDNLENIEDISLYSYLKNNCPDQLKTIKMLNIDRFLIT